MRVDDEFPGLYQHKLTAKIRWRFYKHWGQGVYAGEGKEIVNGDRSGCARIINGMSMTSSPCVAQARIYETSKAWISAVYSYPGGLGPVDHYFWEIWTPSQDLMEDIERYDTEDEMEQRIIELLG